MCAFQGQVAPPATARVGDRRSPPIEHYPRPPPPPAPIKVEVRDDSLTDKQQHAGALNSDSLFSAGPTSEERQLRLRLDCAQSHLFLRNFGSALAHSAVSTRCTAVSSCSDVPSSSKKRA
ncbi:hypothetical protein JCM11251_003330 [Rhodosporidiobolus azoricus]